MIENKEYLTEQLITYIGNKRKLLSFIEKGIDYVKSNLNKEKLIMLDGFAGSGIVSRFMKQHALILHSNDLEKYSYIIGECYLSNLSDNDLDYIKTKNKELNELKYRTDLGIGIIEKLYAPKDTDNIKDGERTFYTNENAKIIDNIRRSIDLIIDREDMKKYFIAPLLSEASIHTNTSGVFKGFYKSKSTGIGKFGGDGENALNRILGEITLPLPVLSNNECEYKMFNKDTNQLVIDNEIEYDVVYLDPPYNQHPYGSNYHMLNTIYTYEEPKKISKVSGIPTNWNKSDYNKKQSAITSFKELIENTHSKFILISYNNEGIIPTNDIIDILESYGIVSLLDTDYNTFRGCRNLRDRNIKVKEQLYILEKNK